MPGNTSFHVLERLLSLRALDVFLFGTAIPTPPYLRDGSPVSLRIYNKIFFAFAFALGAFTRSLIKLVDYALKHGKSWVDFFLV